ncbi:TonB-dependent receptor domain-containing protein [Bacteroidota bacterium]
MKHLYFSTFLLILLMFNQPAEAQRMGGPSSEHGPGGGFQGQNQSSVTGQVSGTLVDSLQNPIQFASTAIYETDSYSPITGVITDEKGKFLMRNIPVGDYTLEISYVGFRKIRIKNIDLSAENRDIKLGDITLLPSSEMLEGVVVSAERPNVDYQIDRKVVSVSQDIVAKGGSVVEALESVPSVKTDINGDVTVRGSANFMVLVDGKPSVLTGSNALQQIPANTVENIEIITNPSARFDPDGDAGIINVIMKKRFADGISTVVNASTGTPNQYGFDVSTNYTTEKGTLTAAIDYRKKDINMDGDMYRETYYEDTTEYQSSFLSGIRARENLNFKLGYNLNLDLKNSLSVQGMIGQRKNNNSTLTNTAFSYFPESNSLYQQSDNNSINEGTQYNLSSTFTRNFDMDGHKLDIGATFMGSVGESVTDLVEYEAGDTWQMITPIFTQLNLDDSDYKQFRFNSDYVKPFGNNGKLELGYQARLENTDSHYEYSIIKGMGIESEEETTINDLTITRNIQSAYAVYSNTLGYFGYQIGLRPEYTGRNVEELTDAETFTIDRIDLFPSAHLNYKFFSGEQIHASYSRRVNRPQSRQINPFPMYLDSRNIKVGNPLLEPEYIDSYELNFIKQFGMSFVSAEAFYRKTNNVITPVQSINEDGILESTYDNLDTDHSYGLEATVNLQLFEWWRFTASSSIYQYTIEGDVSGEYVDNSSLSWNARLMSMFTLPMDMKLQLNSIYNSDRASAQGSRSGFMMTNFAIRKDFMNDKLGLTFQAHDIFRQMNFSNVSESEFFYSSSERRPETPMFSINLSLKLNNYKKSKSRYGSDMSVMEMDYQTDFGL